MQTRTLVPNYYALILAVSIHVRITIIADGEYVRRQLPDFTILVEFDLFRGINRQYLIWIDSDQDGTCVRLQNYYVILCLRGSLDSCTRISLNRSSLIVLLQRIIRHLRKWDSRCNVLINFAECPPHGGLLNWSYLLHLVPRWRAWPLSVSLVLTIVPAELFSRQWIKIEWSTLRVLGLK